MLANISGLLSWRTAAKLAGWWLLMCGAGIVGLSAWRQTRWIPWFLLGLTVLFAIDMGVQGVVRGFFGSTPTASLLVEALANTNSRESMEFVREHWRSVLLSTAFASFVIACGGFLWFFLDFQSVRYSKVATVGMILLVVVVGFNPTMLRQNPIARWPVLMQMHWEAQKGIAEVNQQMNQVDAQSAQWGLQIADSSPRTVILIVGESGNRNNWGLYGYARDTTVPLADTLANLSGRAWLFDHAWSSDAFTLPSLTKALTPATKEQPDLWRNTPAITQLAKVAGFKTAWLSNQTAQEGWFEALAQRTDYARFINHGNWRDSSSTDIELLPVLRERLQQRKDVREFIVVHLMGQHFYYQQRCPVGVAPFNDADDEVAIQLKTENRLPHVKLARNEYDNAIFCESQVLSQLLTTVYELRPDRPVGVLFFSDHGQEVGHHRNFSGHTQQELSGFSIPMWLWVNEFWPEQYPAQYAQRDFRSDWMDVVVQSLLGIRSAWYDAQHDILSPEYKPTEIIMPTLSD